MSVRRFSIARQYSGQEKSSSDVRCAATTRRREEILKFFGVPSAQLEFSCCDFIGVTFYKNEPLVFDAFIKAHICIEDIKVGEEKEEQ